MNKIVEANKSARACNTLAELNHSMGSANLKNADPEKRAVAEQKAALAAKYYMTSAEQEDVIGMHWMGVFYYEGFGVSKNLAKSVEFLTKAAAAGNCQSMYQLHMITSGNDGEDDNYRDVEASYNWLMKGIQNGATMFDEAVQYFKLHFETLAPIYLARKKLDVGYKEGKEKQDVLNMHDAGINEMKNDFSASLGKDRLYRTPCGFLND